MLSPYPGRGLGKWKDSFNFWLSHSRQSIERYVDHEVWNLLEEVQIRL
jgi:hypothetical protein